MNWFQKLPNSRRTASGLEWALWKKLPLIAAAGTFLPLVGLACAYLLSGESPEPAQARWLLMMGYAVVGFIIFHWSLVMTAGIGCLIVMAMKGPGYVADGYLLPHSELPRKSPETRAESAANRPPGPDQA